jgi:hypothetical protein
MLKLLTLPIELLRLAFHALQGFVDALRARNRLRFEFTILINAPREAVWWLSMAEHVVFDGPPVMGLSRCMSWSSTTPGRLLARERLPI